MVSLDSEQPSVEASPLRHRRSSTGSNSVGGSGIGAGDDDTNVGDAEDFAVLPSAADERVTADNDTKSDAGTTSTSFTADSPYFDAFCENEFISLDLLSTTLSEIAMRAKIFAQTGAMMSQATLRLANACKLKHGGEDEDMEPSERGGFLADIDPDLYNRRKNAIGDEMAGALELLGEVSAVSRKRIPRKFGDSINTMLKGV